MRRLNSIMRTAGVALAGTMFAASAFAADISGAGATFPYPIYSKWADAYKKETGNGLNYQSIGSGGSIKQIKVNTLGGVLQPGMEIMEVVPLEDTFLIETKVRPSDVGFIHPGQEAMVKLTAYDFSIYGGLEANVENISADTITEDKNGKSESYYLVQVRTKSGTFTGTHKKLPIIPGMVATVHIKTGKKTVLQYLMKPVLKAKYDALRER